MGWLQDFVTNPIGTVTDTVSNVVSNPAQAVGQAWNTGGKTAAELAALYYGAPYLADAATGALGSAGAGAALPGSADAFAIQAAGGAGAGAGAAGATNALGSLAPYAVPAASIIGGYMSAQGAQNAAGTQAAAADRAAQLQYQMWQQQQLLQEPWRQAGMNALGKLQTASDYTPFGMDQFKADPGYQFRLGEGLKALDRQAAARGGLISGAALKAAQGYGQDQASQEYTNAFNRYQTERQAKLGPLQSLAGVGQTAANTLGNAAQNYATGAGNAYNAAGQATAAGQLGVGNTINNALGTMASAYQNQNNFNNWLSSQNKIG